MGWIQVDPEELRKMIAEGRLFTSLSDDDNGNADAPKPGRRKLPVPGRVHPKEGGFTARTKGRAVGGHPIVVSIKKTRHSVCGMRDHQAKAGSSAKRSRFVASMAHIDRALDRPAPVPVGSFVPKRRMAVKAVAPCRRAK